MRFLTIMKQDSAAHHRPGRGEASQLGGGDWPSVNSRGSGLLVRHSRERRRKGDGGRPDAVGQLNGGVGDEPRPTAAGDSPQADVRHGRIAACLRAPSGADCSLGSLIGAPNQDPRFQWRLGFGYWDFREGGRGGVPDSTLGWNASLPVEDDGWPRKTSVAKTIGNYEEMPLAA